MNPVLLKPQSEIGAQVIVQGKVFGAGAGARLPGAEAEADGGRAGLLGEGGRGCRSRHRRGRRLAGRDQSAQPGHRQYGLCDPRRRAGGPGRRHRPRRRHRLDRRHASDPAGGGPAHDRRLSHQQVPRRRFAVRRRRRGDRTIHRLALLRRRAVAEGGGTAAVGRFGRARTAGVGREARAEGRRADAWPHRQFRRPRPAQAPNPRSRWCSCRRASGCPPMPGWWSSPVPNRPSAT